VLRAQYLRFRLAHAPSRPFVEPVLKNLAFRPDRDWLEFSLSRSTKLAAAPVPRDVRFREAIADDLPELARIDREAFPDHPMPAELIERRLDEEWTIVAERGGQIAGFCRHTMAAPDAGWISVLAVGAAHRGVGLGAALTTRGAKRLFAEGAREAGLTTDGDNAPAIALYRKLGFRQSASGRDYRRPTDPKAIQKFIQDRRGIHIKFGGWR
jgi:mycothiol synthase